MFTPTPPTWGMQFCVYGMAMMSNNNPRFAYTVSRSLMLLPWTSCARLKEPTSLISGFLLRAVIWLPGSVLVSHCLVILFISMFTHPFCWISQTWEWCRQQQSRYLGHKDWPRDCRLFPKGSKQLVIGIMHVWWMGFALTCCYPGISNGLMMKSIVPVWLLVKFSSGRARILANVSSGSCAKGQHWGRRRRITHKCVLSAVWARLKLEGVAQFSLSPGKAPAVAVFIPEKNVS